MARIVLFITTIGAGSFTIPADCSLADIECLAAGGAGSSLGGGGGGGSWAKAADVVLTPGAVLSFQVGDSANVTQSLKDTFFGTATYSTAICSAGSGTAATSISGGLGGGFGQQRGGSGGSINLPQNFQGSSPFTNPAGTGGTGGNSGANGGGGGAASGPTYIGGSGGFDFPGSPGFGASNPSPGGQGGAPGASGTSGTDWLSSAGIVAGTGGGGGGQAIGSGTAGAGAQYGGGGGGGGSTNAPAGQGLIVFSYNSFFTGGPGDSIARPRHRGGWL